MSAIRGVVPWLTVLAFGFACAAPAPSAAPPARTAAPAPATAASAGAASAGAAPAAAPASAPASGAPSAPALVTAPVVDLKVGVLPIASGGALFVAQERGYFRDVGLNVELVVTPGVLDQLPALTQGQLHAGLCAANLACFNGINRRADLKIMASARSGGATEKSSGTNAMVVRKDVWDAGTIRGPHDLIGRSVYTQAGEGSQPYLQGARWLLRNGLDPKAVEWPAMNFPDVYAAMQNRAVEVGFSAEPIVTAGVSRGVHHVLATEEEMHPGGQGLFLMFWTGIERLGPQVGERFLVAFLRGARDYINAFEYGVDQDAIIEILIRETPLKDPAVYRQIKYAWVDPNGLVDRAALEGDAALLYDLGLARAPLDLSQAFDDRYQRFAVQHLGEYRAPRP